MPTPTTGITFSSIQTEFGGANPISMSEYYRGGSAGVPIGQATSITDTTAISASGAIRIGMFRGLTKTVIASGNFVSGDYGPSSFYTLTQATATCSATIQVDGTITTTGNAGTSNWWTPTTVSIGNSKYIRVLSTSGAGTAVSPPLTTWLLLNTARIFSNSKGGIGPSTRTWTVEFSNDGVTASVTRILTLTIETGGAV